MLYTQLRDEESFKASDCWSRMILRLYFILYFVSFSRAVPVASFETVAPMLVDESCRTCWMLLLLLMTEI